MKAALIVGLILLQGCSVVSSLGAAVDAYCAVPDPARVANRIIVNATIAPNNVAITCADDLP